MALEMEIDVKRERTAVKSDPNLQEIQQYSRINNSRLHWHLRLMLDCMAVSVCVRMSMGMCGCPVDSSIVPMAWRCQCSSCISYEIHLCLSTFC